MKKIRILFFLALAALILWISYIVVCDKKSQDLFVRGIEAYLEGKYNRDVTILEYIPEYHGAPAAKACFVNDPGLTFFSYPHKDYYFVTHLEEAAKILMNFFHECRIYTTVSLNSFDDMERKRMMFYQEQGRPISWYDPECKEKLSRIHINMTFDFTKKDAENMVNTVLEMFSKHLDDSADMILSGENCQYRCKFNAYGVLITEE